MSARAERALLKALLIGGASCLALGAAMPAFAAQEPSGSSPAPAAPSVVVQTGSFSTETAAGAAAAKLRPPAPLRVDVTPGVAANGKPVFRVVVAGFEDQKAARDYCSALARAGTPCFVRLETGGRSRPLQPAPTPAPTPAPPPQPTPPSEAAPQTSSQRPPRRPLPSVSADGGGAEPPRVLNPTNRDISLIAPLRDNGSVLGDVQIVLTADQRILLNARDLASALGPSLDPVSLQNLEQRLAAETQIPPEALAELGIQITYNPGTLDLSAKIPPGSRPLRQLKIADLDRASIGEFAKPLAFSGYMNLRTAIDYIHEGGDTGLGDLSVFSDSAVRFRDVVFETEASLAGGEDLRRLGSRFVYDDLKRTTRWTAGDLRPAVRGFQGSPQVAGVSLVRSYAELAPQRNIQPRGERTFTLDRASTVEAFINGQSIRRLRLDPGVYNVRDFPFAQGANDVRLLIEDDTGARETLEFSLFFDRTLLAPGLSEYGVYGGVRSVTTDTGFDYDTGDFIVSGFFRRGLSDRLTLGANAQTDEATRQVGGELLASTSFGTFGLDAAVSDSDLSGTGYAINASFDRSRQLANERSESLNLTLQTRSPEFAVAGQIFSENPYEFEGAATYGRTLGQFSYISASARYAKGRTILNPDVSSLRLTYGFRVSQDINVTLDGTVQENNNRTDTGIRLSLTRRFGDRTSARFDYDSITERARIGAQTSRGRGVGAWTASADIDAGPDSTGLNAAATYTANRAELGINHVTAFESGGSGISDQRTQLRAATAIAFGGGRVALSRPIQDGFALVAPHASLKGASVEIDSSPEGHEGRSGVLGPAVATGISAFSERSFAVDAPGAPPGYDIGSGTLRVFPPYRAGYLQIVGSDYSVTAIGRLVLSSGEPLALVAGRAIEEGEGGKSVQVFTNQTGRFGATGMRPGIWKLEMPGPDGPQTYRLEIARDAEGIVRLGDISPVSTQAGVAR